MKSWGLSFITEENFKKHVAATIEKYGEKLESFDIKRFNKNIVDPIKLIFDKTVYQTSWKEMVAMKSLDREINLITMTLDIFIREYSSTLTSAMFLRMAKKVVGM